MAMLYKKQNPKDRIYHLVPAESKSLILKACSDSKNRIIAFSDLKMVF